MTIVNFYLLLVGGVGSIVLALPQFAQTKLPNVSTELDTLLFFFVGLTGAFTLIKLIRLRQAWHDSARAMNRIKEYYLKHFPELDEAFLWKPHSIPPPGKPWTITFFLSLLITIVDSVAIAIAVQSAGIRSSLGEYLPAILAGVLFFLWQWFVYLWQLPRQSAKA